MTKRPAFQFYPADWRKDPALSTCSLAARGLWIEMMCIAHESEQYGVLTIAGKSMSAQQIARGVGESPSIVAKLLLELEGAAVFSRKDDGCIYSRRMVSDERLRNVRADAGRLGGNPVLLAGKVKQKVKQTTKQKPTPSSSSSSSEKYPHTPSRGLAVGLTDWLAAIKASGDVAIPEDDPVFAYAAETGIPQQFLRLCWLEFRHRYGEPGAKKYRDWRAVFRKAVRGNWLKLWWLDAGNGQYGLTTVGLQAQRAHEERKAA